MRNPLLQCGLVAAAELNEVLFGLGSSQEM